MKAYELRGVGLERLVAVERPDPVPGPGEVLLRMRAVGLNARDLQIMQGHHPVGKAFPLIPLSDGVGEVIGVGERVTRAKVGDRVAGIFAQRWLAGPRTPEAWSSTLGGDIDGVLQERMVLSQDGIVLVPPHLTDEEAATLPTAAVTAWQAVMTRGAVRPGEAVLVQGTGAVSLFALQFARLAGAKVIVTSASAAKRARALEAGASEVVDRTLPDWAARVRKLTRGEGVDHVVDVSGDLNSSIACVCTGGLISQIGYLGGTRLQADIIPMLLSNARLHAISVGPRTTFEEMNRAIAFHRLRPIIDSVVSFEDIESAFTAISRKERFGKVIVTLGGAR
jgi:NADPH:quinone reductase-like Zn-dependent oxidoreductase